MISPDLIKRFQQIAYYFNQHAYSQVVSLFSSVLTIDKVPVEIAQMYAIALRRLGHLEKSNQSFAHAIKVFPANPALRNSFGNLLLEQHLPELAFSQFDEAIKLSPNDASCYLNAARALAQLGKLEQAISYCRAALKLSPSDSNVAIALAENLCRVNKAPEALALYQEILNKQPDNIKALNNLGNLKRRSGHIQEAISLLQRAAATNNPIVLRNLAACYTLHNQFMEACRVYQRALVAAPDDTVTHTDYANLLWQQGDDAPFKSIEQQLETQPQNHALRIEYIKILLKINKPDIAESYLVPLIAQFPADSSVLTLATMVYRDNGDLGQAELYGRKALANEQGASDIGARSELAYTLLAQHKAKEARELYKQLCIDDPFNQGWWTTYSTALKLCNDDTEYAWLCDYSLVNVSDLSDSANPDSLPADFNQQLLPLLETLHCNVREPLGLSLQKGSQTFENIFDRKDILLQKLRLAVLAQARAFISSLASKSHHPFLSRLSTELDFQGSWSVQLRDEGFHKSHFHPMGWLSGVYYVDIPDAVEHDGQGWLIFARPDIPNVQYEGDYAVKPKSGTLVLFPSFMWHGTNPFKSSSKRVSVAFDLVPRSLAESST